MSLLFVSRYRQIKQQYDLKVHEAELVQARLKQSTHHHQLEEVEALQKTVGTLSASFEVLLVYIALEFRIHAVTIAVISTNYTMPFIGPNVFAAMYSGK